MSLIAGGEEYFFCLGDVFGRRAVVVYSDGHWELQERQAYPKYMMNWRAEKWDDRPDQFVMNPTLSTVVEVKAAELIMSTSFSAGLTLRFPRIVKIRHDKAPSDADTMGSILELFHRNGGKLTRRTEDGEYENDGPSERRKQKRTGERLERRKLTGQGKPCTCRWHMYVKVSGVHLTCELISCSYF
jgi:hypothetical protein